MEYVEDRAKIISVNKNKVTFEMINNGSCKSCGMQGICGTKNNPILHTTYSDLDLKKDDIVKVHLSSGVKILSAFILFLFPILSMILFYALAKYAFLWKEDFAILFSVFGLILSGVFIFIFDKKFSKKVHFEIIEVIK